MRYGWTERKESSVHLLTDCGIPAIYGWTPCFKFTSIFYLAADTFSFYTLYFIHSLGLLDKLTR